MELIKQIKDAEKQAKEIKDNARRDAAKLLDEVKGDSENLREQAQRRRHEAIDKAVADAEAKGRSEVEELIKQGDQEIAALKESSSDKIKGCVEKVISNLREAL